MIRLIVKIKITHISRLLCRFFLTWDFLQCCSHSSCCIVLGVSRGQEQRDRSQSSRQFGHFDAGLSPNSTQLNATRVNSAHWLASSCQAEWQHGRGRERARGGYQGSWSARDRGRGEACYHKIGVNELQSPFWRRHCQLIRKGWTDGEARGREAERGCEVERVPKCSRHCEMSVIWTIWWMVICHEMAKWSLFFITPLHSTPLHSTRCFPLVSFLCFIFAFGFVFLFLFFPLVVASFYQLYIAHFAPFRRLPSMTKA